MIRIPTIKIVFLLFTVFFYGTLSAPAALAQTRYISDVIFVPLRSGPGNQYRIINAAMRSGTRLEQLEENDDGSWARVKTSAGVEGWMRTQYLSDEVPARQQLAQSENQLTSKNQQVQTLQQQNATLESQVEQLQAQLNNINSSQQETAQELQEIKKISANAIAIDKAHNDLLEKHQLVLTERDTLKAENEQLKADQRLSFMFYGAGLIIGGMILATILPALRPRKRYSEWA